MNTHELRQEMIEIVQNVGKGHLGTSLSSLEIILAIYETMRPQDIFISSKGHDALAQYIALREKGILTDEEVKSFRQPGGLPSHPTVDIPGIAANTGSLGMGLSKALGFAISDPNRRIYVLLGDGEMMEGQNWEAALSISNSRIKNIVAIVDCNNFSQDSYSALTALQIEKMLYAAGWMTTHLTRNHDYIDYIQALQACNSYDMPTALVVDTIKGKGASFEGTWQSHAGPPRNDYAVTHPLYKAFGEAVEKIMEENPLVYLLGADTLRDHNCYHLKDRFPDRVIDFGIAEQNIVSVASALALEKKIPIVVTYAAFLRRAAEQIYNQSTERTKVIYVGSMAGPLEEGGPGISHQSLDDHEWMFWLVDSVGIVRHKNQIYRQLKNAVDWTGSSYIRMLHDSE